MTPKTTKAEQPDSAEERLDSTDEEKEMETSKKIIIETLKTKSGETWNLTNLTGQPAVQTEGPTKKPDRTGKERQENGSKRSTLKPQNRYPKP